MLNRTMVSLINNTSISMFYRLIEVDLKSYSGPFQEPLNLVLLSTDLEDRLTPLESS
jgi:hypothetical protein